MSRARELEALEWVRLTHDPDFADWDAHLAWLEADPDNAAAFDRMLLVADEATSALIVAPVPVVANDNAYSAGARRKVLGWGIGIAAALAGIVGVGALVRQPESATVAMAAYATPPGEQRTLRLADGTRLAMNGDTAIRVGSGKDRSVHIDRGEVYLDVVHDAARPLRVETGDVVLRDVGTRFNVRRDGGQVTVAVQEGAVEYDPDGAGIRLLAGQELHRAGREVTLSRRDPAAIGSWRTGRLIYRDASLATVAADVTRATGEPVVVEPSAAMIRFTGVLPIDRDHARMFHRLGAVADVRVQRYRGAWRVAAQAD